MAKYLNKEKQEFEVSDDVLAKAQSGLENINFDSDDEDDSTPNQKSQISQAEPGDSTPVDEDKDLADSDKGDEDTPTPLPDNYFRAAVHQDWTPEDIQEFYAENPERALKTFKKIYESTNFITKQTADLGRKSKQLSEKLTNAEKPPVLKSEFQEIDIEGIRKKYSDTDDPIIDLIGQLSRQNKVMYDKVNALETSSKPASKTSDEDVKVWNGITNFFGDNALNVFKGFYGAAKVNEDWGTVLTGEQLKNRIKVVEMADQVLAGAELQGRDMDYDEALHLAHLVVSDNIRETIIRNEIKSKIKERSKGITVKSTGGGKHSQDGQPTSEIELEKKTAGRLSKMFGKR